jgi:5'-3' exonuclease
MRLCVIDGDNALRSLWEVVDETKRPSIYKTVVKATCDRIHAKDDDGVSPRWTRVIVAWDGGAGGGVDGFRKARVPEYKANRNDPGAAYRDQRTRCIDALQREHCTVIVGPYIKVGDAEGVTEADDVISWAVAEFCKRADEDSECRVASGDSDVEALALDTPYVYIFKGGKSREDPLYNAERIEMERGVLPELIPEVKALMGDKGDNIIGFDRIGEKTAAMLIRMYGSAAEAAARAPDDDTISKGELKADMRESLRKGGVELALKNLWLATLRPNLPLDFDALVLNPKEPEPKAPERQYFKEEPKPEPPEVTGEPVNKQAIELRRDTSVANINTASLQPNGLGELDAAADMIHASKMFTHLPNKEAIAVIIWTAHERGVKALTALNAAYYIPGRGDRPSQIGWKASYIHGLVISSPACEYCELVPDKCDDTKATVRFKRRGRPEATFTYTIEDAQRAGLLEKSTWRMFRKAMLRAAAVRECARAFFPDVVNNMYMPDELSDDNFAGSADI